MTKKERPILPNLINDRTLDIEKFQNEVFRPIIKMQHPLLIIFFQNYVLKRKIDFKHLSEEKKAERIQLILSKDTSFRNIILGSILGHFSKDEIKMYHENASELNRRIVQIIKQRLQDSISEL